MSKTMVHSGKCFCGKVRFDVSGESAAMGYCHCSSCREWSAAPVNAFALWPLDAVKITKGADDIEFYRRTAESNSVRKWCKICVGQMFADVPAWNSCHSVVAIQTGASYELSGESAGGERRITQTEGPAQGIWGVGSIAAGIRLGRQKPTSGSPAALQSMLKGCFEPESAQRQHPTCGRTTLESEQVLEAAVGLGRANPEVAHWKTAART
jgi:hypothetical protein